MKLPLILLACCALSACSDQKPMPAALAPLCQAFPVSTQAENYTLQTIALGDKHAVLACIPSMLKEEVRKNILCSGGSCETEALTFYQGKDGKFGKNGGLTSDYLSTLDVAFIQGTPKPKNFADEGFTDETAQLSPQLPAGSTLWCKASTLDVTVGADCYFHAEQNGLHSDIHLNFFPDGSLAYRAPITPDNVKKAWSVWEPYVIEWLKLNAKANG